MTKGELIKAFEPYPDDMKVVIYCDDAGGYTDMIEVRTQKYEGREVIELTVRT